MRIRGNTVTLNGNELATAVDAYLKAHNIAVCGPRTIRIRTLYGDSGLCGEAKIIVDPSGKLVDNR